MPASTSSVICARDQLHDPGLNDPGARGDQPQGGVPLLLDEGAEGGRVRERAVEAVEGVQQAGAALSLEPGSGLDQHGLGRPSDHLADQVVARPEPAIDRGPADPDVGRDRLDVDPLPAQVAVEARLDDVLAGGGGRTAALSRRSHLRHT